MIGFGTNRNSPIPCSLMADLELTPWASDTPAMQVPEDLLRQSIQRATIDFALRREQEFQLFKTSKVANIYFESVSVTKLLCATDKGADPKSPLGIASAFNRPNAAAIFMSNTSLLLEYASEEFINHLEQ